MKTPKPSGAYKNAQKELAKCQTLSDQRHRCGQLRSQLESEFMQAWKLLPDQRKQAEKIKSRLLPGGGASESGLDHCSFYYSLENAASVIVSQPYGQCVDRLEQTVTLGRWAVPEIIYAPEWAFYAPGKAELYLILFPFNYGKAIAALACACSR